MAFRPPRQKADNEAGGFKLLLRFVHRYLWPHRRRMAVCALMLSLSACTPYLMAYYGRVVVDRILVVGTAEAPAAASAAPAAGAGRGDRWASAGQLQEPMNSRSSVDAPGTLRPPGAMGKLMAMFAIYMGTLVGLNGLSRLLQGTRVRIGQQVTAQLREDMHQKVMQLSLSYHRSHAPGRLLARILSDVTVVQDQLMATILDVVSNVVMLVVGIVILFTVSWQMGLIACSVLPVYAFLYNRSRDQLREINKELRHTNSCMYGLASQKLEGIRTVQAYGRERYERLAFHRLSACFLRDTITQQLLGAGLGRAAGIVGSVGTGSVFLYATSRVLNGSMTFGEMMFGYGAAANLFTPVLALSQISLTVTRLLVILQRLVRVLDEPVEIVDAPDAVNFPSPLRSRISLRHVHFSYGPSMPPVIEDILLDVPAGRWLCIMGASGAGKTTLLYLLNRLYEPVGGEIWIDGIALQKIRMNSLRQRMALVPQEPQIFSGTVRENICYGFPEAEPRQIVLAAKAAEIHDFIMQLPVKYETLLGERGTTLSGGQRQRLSLARALITDPDVLLLDDCTSALDADTEQKIQETLTRVLRGRTAVIVSQRVSMAQRCHSICVLDGGFVSEHGTHAQLIAQRGFYARLHAQQTAMTRTEAGGRATAGG